VAEEETAKVELLSVLEVEAEDSEVTVKAVTEVVEDMVAMTRKSVPLVNLNHLTEAMEDVDEDADLEVVTEKAAGVDMEVVEDMVATEKEDMPVVAEAAIVKEAIVAVEAEANIEDLKAAHTDVVLDKNKILSIILFITIAL